jgi:EAL domain-containing protein (putative c-di-GMP-specific phosphodiesterase class I)
VAALIEEAGIDPRRIELELTESLLMADARAAVSVLTDLKALGVTLAIDDFGTGYSSLSYLKRLPVDVIKIDQSFIREIGSADGGLIVDTVIKLARGLRLQTVAEGVEVAEQLEFLKRSGCGIAQGYLFSAPLPAPEFRAWCAARAARRAVQGVA